MDGIHLLLRILLETGAVLVLTYAGVRLIRYARRRSTGAYVLGAALLLFGLGNVQDPRNEALLVAQQLKPKKGNESGDPPEDENYTP